MEIQVFYIELGGMNLKATHTTLYTIWREAKGLKYIKLQNYNNHNQRMNNQKIILIGWMNNPRPILFFKYVKINYNYSPLIENG